MQEGPRKLEGAWHSESVWTATQRRVGVRTAEQRQRGKVYVSPPNLRQEGEGRKPEMTESTFLPPKGLRTKRK